MFKLTPRAPARSLREFLLICNLSGCPSLKTGEHECCICLETFENYLDPPIRIPNISGCTHVFGRHCIKKWAREGKDNCPLCRQVLYISGPARPSLYQLAHPLYWMNFLPEMQSSKSNYTQSFTDMDAINPRSTSTQDLTASFENQLRSRSTTTYGRTAQLQSSLHQSRDRIIVRSRTTKEIQQKAEEAIRNIYRLEAQVKEEIRYLETSRHFYEARDLERLWWIAGEMAGIQGDWLMARE